MQRLVAAIAGLILYLGAFGIVNAAGERRVALVIGNANYANVPALLNPLRDADLIAETLRTIGFDVVEVKNADAIRFRAALKEFSHVAAGADVAMIYYGGHGLQASGRNWLIPVDAKLQTETDLNYEAFELDLVVRALEGSHIQILALDASRNNPFSAGLSRATRGLATVSHGLAPVDIDVDGLLVIYSAGLGQVASDGDLHDSNSPFAQALARRMAQPGLDIHLLGPLVRDDVLRMTEGQQRPYVESSISGNVFALVPDPSLKSSSLAVAPRLSYSRQPRLALVIGNGDYNNDGIYIDDRYSVAVMRDGFAPDLPNTINDSADVRDALAQLNFSTIDYIANGDRDTMGKALFKFEKEVKKAGPDAIVVIYYAGHAIQVGGENYLVPTSTKLPHLDVPNMSESQVEFELEQYAIPIKFIFERLQNPSPIGLNLLILDACRENPWTDPGSGRSIPGASGVGRGLADVRVRLRRTAIAFATKPGDVASDGIGRNSPYTAALKSWLVRPGVNVRDMFDGIAEQVETDTKQVQSPWFNTPGLGGVCLGLCRNIN